MNSSCRLNVRLNLNFLIGILLITNFTGGPMMAQQTVNRFRFEIQEDVYLEARFLLYLPEGYEELKRDWPLLLFLHGSGERGEMIELVKKHGPPMLIEHGREFPYIVVSPQCPEGQWWDTELLDLVLTQVVEQYRVNVHRIYVTGLSMGGFATWELAIEYPDRFAAIVPVCGGADAQFAPLIKRLPIWAFHGAKDDVVPVSAQENMVNALKSLGSPVKFTVYPDAGHDSWTDAYNDPDLWEWLGEQSR